MAAGALCAPLVAVGVRWHEGREGARRLTEGVALLEAPLERAASLEALDVARAQQLFETARWAQGSGREGTRARALWHVAQAWADLARGELSLAQQEADTAEGLAPGDAHARLVLATVAARRGDRVRAEQMLEALAREGVPPAVAARAMLLRLDLLLESGRAHDALVAAEALDREHPQVSAVKNLLGLSRAAVGDRAGAREAFQRAAALDPRDASPLVNLARLSREEGDLAAARTTLERALAVAPDHAEAWLAYGVVLMDLRAPEARHALVRAGALAPDDAAPYVAQGNLDLAEGNLPGAIESFRQALAREPEHPTAQTNLGIALARRGDRAGALDAFECATRRAPQQGEAWNGLGAMRLAEGDAERAVGPLQQATVLLPHDPNPALNLGRALEALRRWDDAARAFREALRRDPDNEVAVRHLVQLNPSCRLSVVSCQLSVVSATVERAQRATRAPAQQATRARPCCPPS
jgi:tetratricopeptide (TPR) repeat protein